MLCTCAAPLHLSQLSLQLLLFLYILLDRPARCATCTRVLVFSTLYAYRYPRPARALPVCFACCMHRILTSARAPPSGKRLPRPLVRETRIDCDRRLGSETRIDGSDQRLGSVSRISDSDQRLGSATRNSDSDHRPGSTEVESPIPARRRRTVWTGRRLDPTGLLHTVICDNIFDQKMCR